MKTKHGWLALLLIGTAMAQTAPATRPAAPATRPAQSRPAGPTADSRPPDPNLFDGSKFEAEKIPDMGMLGEFEMPGGDAQNAKVGGNPGQAGGNQAPPNAASAAGGTAGAASASGAGASAEAGSQGAAGAGVDSANSAGAVGGAMDQNSPAGSAGPSGGASDPNAKAEGIAAGSLQGASGGAAAAQSSAGQSGKSKPSVNRIGSAELRIDTPAESDKDVVGREAAAGGTQGSNRAMPSGQGGQGAQNQNKGVEKGKVMPKGL